MPSPAPFLFLFALAAPASPTSVLHEIAEKWSDERHRWAFTQLVRESDKKGLVQERVERYDPVRGEAHRWKLISLNGRKPTPGEEETWGKRKNRPRKRDARPLTEYLDIEHTRLLHEDDSTMRLELPLRRSFGWIFPGEKVDVILTVNKQSRMIERAQVTIDGPFNVALGLARVVDLDFDLEFSAGDKGPAVDPGADPPRGTAYAVVNKLGRRIEYSWSDFTRLPAPPDGHW